MKSMNLATDMSAALKTPLTYASTLYKSDRIAALADFRVSINLQIIRSGVGSLIPRAFCHAAHLAGQSTPGSESHLLTQLFALKGLTQ